MQAFIYLVMAIVVILLLVVLDYNRVKELRAAESGISRLKAICKIRSEIIEGYEARTKLDKELIDTLCVKIEDCEQVFSDYEVKLEEVTSILEDTISIIYDGSEATTEK